MKKRYYKKNNIKYALFAQFNYNYNINELN